MSLPMHPCTDKGFGFRLSGCAYELVLAVGGEGVVLFRLRQKNLKLYTPGNSQHGRCSHGSRYLQPQKRGCSDPKATGDS